MAFALMLLLAAAPPEVAWLCAAADDGDFAELRFQRVADPALAPAVARFSIVPRSTVTGVVLPGTRAVLAVAYTVPSRDETWAFSLLRLEAGAAARVLVDRIGAATRPVVTSSGRVFVERGSAGEATSETWRIDTLRIDEVDPNTGAVRNVLSTRGFWAALAGTLGSELFVYRVDERGAQLVAIDFETRESRTLRPSMPATANDFTVDAKGNALFYTVGDTSGWRVERVDLKTNHVRVVATGQSVAMLPTVFPDGRMAVAPRIGGGLTSGESQLLAPQGPGYERVRFFEGGLALGLHERPSEFPSPFAVSLSEGKKLVLLAPTQMRLELAGVLP